MAANPLLAAQKISKSFGPVKACAEISLALGTGEIVALLGENGAGKSTFVKLVFGVLEPDSGGFVWKGRPIRFAAPSVSRAAGIGMVHQHFSLFEAFTVTENIALALPDQPMATLRARTREISAQYGLPLDPDALVADLSAGERQRIEIVRCLLQDPTLIIMDEPTSVLTPQEAERLFVTLRRLREEGRTILYISHKLDEVRALCERAIVMRAGRIVCEVDPRTTSSAALAEAMVGAAVATVTRPDAPEGARPLLQINDLSHESDRPFGTSLQNVSLTVRAGEVLGIAGMAGNGQSELFACLSGELLSDDGAVVLKGQRIGGTGIDARRALGGAFVPEERLGHSAVPSFDLVENIILSRHRAADGTVGPLGILRRGTARKALARVIAAMDVRAASPAVPARALSGGNLQKLVMGRDLDREPDVLVVNQPTWGVDAGAAANIRQAIVDLAARGAGVVVISQDLDELFEIAQRIAVIAEGRLSSAKPTASLSRTEVGLMMGGAGAPPGEAKEPAVAS